MISALKYFWAQVLLANPGLVSLWRVSLGMASVYRAKRVSLIVDLDRCKLLLVKDAGARCHLTGNSSVPTLLRLD